MNSTDAIEQMRREDDQQQAVNLIDIQLNRTFPQFRFFF